MVCIYCGSPTSVVNSRRQRRNNSIWRRRKCETCGTIFTSIEQADLAAGLRVETTGGHLAIFERDRLFVSIYECCKHRSAALHEAANLTQQVINHIVAQNSTPGLLPRETLVGTTHQILKQFDSTAAMVYAAYHPLQGPQL